MLHWFIFVKQILYPLTFFFEFNKKVCHLFHLYKLRLQSVFSCKTCGLMNVRPLYQMWPSGSIGPPVIVIRTQLEDFTHGTHVVIFILQNNKIQY